VICVAPTSSLPTYSLYSIVMSGPRPGQPGGQFSTQDNPKIAPPPEVFPNVSHVSRKFWLTFSQIVSKISTLVNLLAIFVTSVISLSLSQDRLRNFQKPGSQKNRGSESGRGKFRWNVF